MRSEATISRRSPSSYISRTLPRATSGRSSSAVTSRSLVERDLVQARDDLGRVPCEGAGVEDLVEVEARGARVGGEQLAQRRALRPGPPGQLLCDAVGA